MFEKLTNRTITLYFWSGYTLEGDPAPKAGYYAYESPAHAIICGISSKDIDKKSTTIKLTPSALKKLTAKNENHLVTFKIPARDCRKTTIMKVPAYEITDTKNINIINRNVFKTINDALAITGYSAYTDDPKLFANRRIALKEVKRLYGEVKEKFPDAYKYMHWYCDPDESKDFINGEFNEIECISYDLYESISRSAIDDVMIAAANKITEACKWINSELHKNASLKDFVFDDEWDKFEGSAYLTHKSTVK